MNAELERLKPMPERLNDGIRFLDALILNRRFSRVEYEGLARVRGILRDLSGTERTAVRGSSGRDSGLQAEQVVAFHMKCVTCGTASYQPNERCAFHASVSDVVKMVQTEQTLKDAWTKRAYEAEAALAVSEEIRQQVEQALQTLMDHCGAQGWWLESHAVDVMNTARAALASSKEPQ
jgi:hypothetical protein